MISKLQVLLLSDKVIARCESAYSSIESDTTCDGFDDFVSLVVAAVASLEGDLVGSTVWSFKPRLQESSQVLQHVLLESFACSSYLEERKMRTRDWDKSMSLSHKNTCTIPLNTHY